MIVLNEQQIKQFYGMERAIVDVKATLRSKANKKILTPFRTVIDFEQHDASILYMPSADAEQQYSANKIVSIFPHNAQEQLPTTQGITLLTDAKNGSHLALLNASYLTRLRTGALSAIASDYLARKDATSLAVIGTGGMAFEQALGILAIRPIKQVQLFNRTVEKAQSFKERLLALFPNLNVTIAPTVDDAVKEAHIINCATRSTTAVFNHKFVAPGTHINGVGSYLPHMREIDEALIVPGNKIVVDDMHGVMEEAGEFMHAAEVTDWSFDMIHGSLEALEMKEVGGRENEEEITIFKSVGASYYDLAVAIGVYKEALEKGIGTTITV